MKNNNVSGGRGVAIARTIHLFQVNLFYRNVPRFHGAYSCRLPYRLWPEKPLVACRKASWPRTEAGKDRSRCSLIDRVRLTESFGQQGFFTWYPDDSDGGNQQNADYSDEPVGGDQPRGRQHDQESNVHGMTNDAVGAGLDQLLPGKEFQSRAKIPAQSAVASPQQQESQCAHSRAGKT